MLTDKDKPFSVRANVINNAIGEIIDSKEDLIIVHGGGSFGHPIAKKYKLTGGRDPKISKQVLGVAETHMAMTDLNNLLVKEFMKRNYPILSFQPSVLFFRRSQKALYHSMDVIETALDVGMTPILYGDIIFDEKGSFSIISGDEIILELCKNLKNYNVTKVVFAIEKDGILIAEDHHQVTLSLVSKTTCNELNELNLAVLGKKIDVTGGIRGKLEYVKEICNLGIPIQVVNGLTNNSITKALKSEEVRGTLIIPEKEKRQEKIKDRKVEHLKIPLKFDVLHTYNYFEDISIFL